MPLFDDLRRTDTRSRRQNEPAFEYMNTSARPGISAIRGLLDRWFDGVPEESGEDIRARFRSRRAHNHESAFFELYWHEMLRCCGYQVNIHPELPGVDSNPDFLAHRDTVPAFYFEATLAMPPGNAAADRRFAELHDTLDRMDSPDYFLKIEYSGSPQRNIRGRVIRERLEQWCASLDYDEISRLYREEAYDAIPKLSWTEQGCILTFSPVPKSPEFRGRPGARAVGVVMPAEVRQLYTHEDIRAAIDGKATKYGDLDVPLIVAINVLDDFCDDDDIGNALFGEDQIVTTRHADGRFTHARQRALNGAWRGPRGPRNTLVSAVSIANQLSPSTLRYRDITLIHNPWAINPLPLQALPIPQITVSIPDGRIHEHEGTHHADLMGIPKLWPIHD